MRMGSIHTTVKSHKADEWNGVHTPVINLNKGIDLLPKRGNMPILKRIKLWWTE